MRLMLLGALMLAGIALAAPRPAGAAVDLYRVAGIPVDATAASAVAARERAIADGEREGLRRLLRRLTLPEDEARLPPVAGLKLDDYVQSYEIAEEKLGPTRYIATLNVSYVPDQVQGLLRGAAVPFLDRRPDPVLLLPVLQTDQGPDLWGESNPWRAAWDTGAATSQLVELRLPLGDAGDVSTVTPASLADPAALSALAQRYGAQLTVLAEARVRAGSPSVDLTVTPSDALDQPFLHETVVGQPGADQAAVLGQAAQRAVAAVELGLKRRLIVRDTQLSTLQVGVPLADLSSWVQIRRTLGGVPEVRSVRVDSFGRPEAVVSIDYAGGLDGLTAALRRAGLALDEENGEWRLRRAGGPAGFQAPPPASPATP